LKITFPLNVVFAETVNVELLIVVFEEILSAPPVPLVVLPPFREEVLSAVALNVPVTWPLPLAAPPRLAEPALETVTTLLLIVVAVRLVFNLQVLKLSFRFVFDTATVICYLLYLSFVREEI